MLTATETINSLIDFAMAIFAVFALRGLQTTRSTKWKLAIVFVLAGMAGVIGFVKIGLAFESTICKCSFNASAKYVNRIGNN